MICASARLPLYLLCVVSLAAARVPAAGTEPDDAPQPSLEELIVERAARAKRCQDATIAAHEAETATYEHVLSAIDLRCQADLATSKTALERFNALSRRLEDVENTQKKFDVLQKIGVWRKPQWADYMAARLKLAASVAEVELLRETIVAAKENNAGENVMQLEQRLEEKLADRATFLCSLAASTAFRAGLLDAAELLHVLRLHTKTQLKTAHQRGAPRAYWAAHHDAVRKLSRYCELAWQAGLERPADDGPSARASGRRKNPKLVTELDGLFLCLERERAESELLRVELAGEDSKLRGKEMERRLQELTAKRISTAHELLAAAREDFDAYEIQLPTLIHALEGLKEAELAAATDADERQSALERNLARVRQLQQQIGDLHTAGQRNGHVKEFARIGAHRLTSEIEFLESRQQADDEAAARPQ